MSKVKLEIQLIEGADKAPIYATQGAAGFDFTSREDITIPRYDTKLIPTGIKMSIPEGYAIQVASRSGLALKSQVFVLNAPGIIDSDYRGEIGVILTNAGHEPFVINKGDRIAQGVLIKVEQAEFTILDSLEGQETQRGSGGFGSTGSK